jgi:hypothetical protein
MLLETSELPPMSARIFSAPDGTLWQAWSVIPGQHSDWPANARRHLPDEMAAGWICFESPTEKRRLHPIPAGWDDADDDALRGHCAAAEPVRPRTSSSAAPAVQDAAA